jgi:hypothetical protein
MQGLRHGAGTFYYADGSRYCGQWEENVKCGYGVHTHPDGGVSEGIFKLDRLVRVSHRCPVPGASFLVELQCSARCHAQVAVHVVGRMCAFWTLVRAAAAPYSALLRGLHPFTFVCRHIRRCAFRFLPSLQVDAGIGGPPSSAGVRAPVLRIEDVCYATGVSAPPCAVPLPCVVVTC